MKTPIKVGIFVLLTSLIGAYLILTFSDKEFGVKKNFYYIYFDEVGGLTIGADVEVKGVKVGKVENITFEKNNRIKVKVSVKSEVPIYRDAIAYIRTYGLMGDKYVYIDPGHPEAGKLANEDYIVRSKIYATTEQTFATAEEVAGKLSKLLDNLSESLKKEDLKKIVQGLSKLIENTNQLVEQNKDNINKSLTNVRDITTELKQDLPSLIKKLDKVAQNLDTITSENKENIKELIANLKETSKTLKEKTPKIAEDIDQAAVQVRDTVKENRPDVRNSVVNVKESSEKLKNILTKVDEGEGTIGKLINEDKLYKSANESIEAFSKPFKVLMDSEFDILVYGEKHTGNEDAKSGIAFLLSPKDDRYYYLGFVNNSNGSISKIEESISGGVPTEKVQKKFGILFDVQYARKLLKYQKSGLWFRGGLKESSGDIGIDYTYGNNFKITTDLYKFDRDKFDGEPKHPELDIGLNYYFKRNPFFVKFGGSDLLNNNVRGVYIGGGFLFTDEYIKYLLGAVSATQ
jgi:phospholipid/cholesterol/gamma-HCH transport system substrate-binding protein